MHSIEDVAKRARVSVKTVSRILSGFAGVRPDTRHRVRRAMAELEYYPSAAARSLRGRKARTLGVIAENLTTTPDAFEIVAGIQSECQKHDTVMMIGETSGHAGTFDALVQRFRQQHATAVIYATMFMKKVTIEHSFRFCPLILVNCVDSAKAYPAFIPNDAGGGSAATSELLRLGHRRIAFIGLFEDMFATQQRKRGYLAALRKQHVDIDERLIGTGVGSNGDGEFAPLPGVLKDLFDLKDPPTAIMCGNDKMAMRVFFLLRRTMGKEIPRDVSVVGYDNYRLIAENLLPGLTTVSLPYFDMGAAAVRLALAERAAATTHKINGALIVRESTGKPP